VFCFDYNIQQGYDHDYTGGHVYGDYQQIVHKFSCQGGEDHSDL